MKSCFRSTNILLPNKNVDKYKWAVVACDQYTSQEDYWIDVANTVKDEPSTLNIIYPEVYLGKDDARIQKIQDKMLSYMNDGIIEESIKDGFVLVERTTESGTRLGLVGVIDLEAYDFTPGTNAPIRATEGTIAARIPPRLRIRENALLECSHVMVLIDDKRKQLIEPLYDKKESLECIYDMDLMKNGGHLRGYCIDGKKAQEVNALLVEMEKESGGFFLAVGDGNHSLATAKTHWHNVKESLNEEERIDHPARYALVELVNLHSPALFFEPIHRVVFHVDMNDLYQGFVTYLHKQDISYTQGEDIVFIDANYEYHIQLLNEDGRIPLDILQCYLDKYLQAHKDSSIDYVHGKDAVKELATKDNNCGILLGSINKDTLFPAIAAGGVLPRKTFSMGEAYEKRYYVECRKIQK
ncbi:MAG: DUF1015 domain-containing protein [Erysipelotrichaceae bacterium]|nr:DUF1015 domain-containing protein [Erysipelotrichaceae bacterium]